MARRIPREDRATLIESGNLPGQRPTWHVVVTLAAFVAVFTVLEIGAYTQKSATMDEPIHLAAGYVALVDRDFRVDVTHPPFLRMWAALPLLGLSGVLHNSETIDRYDVFPWQAEAYKFANEFLYGQDADRLLYAARFMVVLLGVALGVLLFAWAYEWLGFVPAVFVLAFYAIEPNLGAHASLVTTDLGTTCFVFGAVYFLWRATHNYTWANIAGLTMCFSLAIVSKFSGVLLAPIVVSLLIVAVQRQQSGVTFRRACALVGLLGAASIAVVWLVYGFRYAPSHSPNWLLAFQHFQLVQQRIPTLARLLAWVDAHRLLPNAFTQGFLFSVATAQQLPTYLLGNYSATGWWYYFPVAFLVKTPDTMIVLMVMGLVVYGQRRRRRDIVNGLFVLLPIAVFMGFAMTSGINIGVRHILPIYPFVLLIAGLAVSALVGARAVTGRVVLTALTAFWIGTFFRVYPHTLTFFNQLAGGPGSGINYLTDSNLDWGQDLKPLKSWMDGHAVQQFNLAYFGTADPSYYRISCTYPNRFTPVTRDGIAPPQLPGYVAISSTILSGVYLPPRDRQFYRAFLEQTPVAEIGNSIRVYWVEQWPEFAGDSLDASLPSRCSKMTPLP